MTFDLDTLTERLARDERVLALFVTGSRADGRADEHSDLDLLVVVAERDVDGLVAQLPTLVHEVEPLVEASTRPLGHATLLNLVTDRCLRVDLVVTSTERAAQAPRFGPVRRLIDRAQVEAMLPEISGPVIAAHGEEWFDALVKGVLRTVALLPMVVARREYIRGAQHVQLLKQDFLELLLFAEGDPPLARPGAWAWSDLNDRLSNERRAQVASLPPAAMTRDAVVDGHVQLLAAFLGVARPLARRSGFVWKHSAYERAVEGHLTRAGLWR